MAPGSARRVCGLILILGTAAGCAGDWPMLAHDAARSGGTAEELKPPFVRKWYRLFPEEGIQTGVQPVVAGDKVYIGTLRGIFHAIEANNGKDSWCYSAGAAVLHAAAVEGNQVFFGTADGSVHALNCADGKPVWRVNTGTAVWNAPAAHAGSVYFGSRSGRFYVVAANSGQTRWTADLGAPVLNSPAVDARAGRVYVGSEAMRIHAFRLDNGEPLWTSEPLSGSTLRGYHPVIAPDGSVMVTTAPVIGYDRFQELLLEMARAVFGDFASWRHTKQENERLRAENFKLMRDPATYHRQLDFIRKRLAANPQFQTFFVLDGQTGRQRFVAPIIASESMNGPGAPPLVTPSGKVIVKYQVLLRSRYEHYSPFLNVGYLDTRTGDIEPIMDQSRTYGWHDSLLLVHDEQCQLSFAGQLLLNTHQDNVNAMDLQTLKGFSQPLALNVHEPAPGEALGIRIEAWRGNELPPGKEWLSRGTAVYGGGSVLDVPVAIANGSFYYLPTHEINSGCALVAYRAVASEGEVRRTRLSAPELTPGEWKQLHDLAWDWDTLSTARLTNFLASLPGPVPGSAAAPLTDTAQEKLASITEEELDEQIWSPAFDPARQAHPSDAEPASELRRAVDALLSAPWRPFVTPAAKAPEHAYRFFNDPAGTIYTLLLARPCLPADRQQALDVYIAQLLEKGIDHAHASTEGQPRESYQVPQGMMQVVDESRLDALARCYPIWLWSRCPAGAPFAEAHWSALRPSLRTAASGAAHDCGNGRLAGLIAYCRIAKNLGDQEALKEALPATRIAMRERLAYEFAHPRGGVIGQMSNGRSAFVRWRNLTPDVARLIAAYALPIEKQLVDRYVDQLRPGWWLAWNAEQMMRNEAPFQLPSTPLEVFTARALILKEPARRLKTFVDLPWCKADEYYVRKLALTLLAPPE